jgi:hypothetical protein
MTGPQEIGPTPDANRPTGLAAVSLAEKLADRGTAQPDLWVEGHVMMLGDLLPGVLVNDHHGDSRRAGAGHDGTEAFQVVAPT